MSNETVPVAVAASAPSPTPHRANVARRYLSSPAGIAGAAAFVILVLVAVLADVLPLDPYAQTATPFQGPSGDHWFGTDELGRDILARVVGGTRAALTVAIGAAVFASVVGVALGVVCGYRGGRFDTIVMRLFDVILGVPGIIVALFVVAVLGSGIVNVLIAIAVAQAPVFGRVARANVLNIREREFVVAARSMGASDLDIMFRTVLRNVTAPLIVQLVVTASVAIVAAASLSFLGLGAPPPEPTWGGMLYSARSFLAQAPLYGVLPGVALAMTITSFTGIGRGIEVATGSSPSRRSRIGGIA